MGKTKIGQTEQNRIFWLDVARVVAIVSISLNHAVNRGYDNYQAQVDEFNSIAVYSTVFKTLVTVFSHLGVPLFLMISGTLLLKKRMDGEHDIKHFYKHNLLGIFVTAEIWYFIMYWVQLFLSGETLREMLSGSSLRGLIKTMLFVNQTTFESMWYIPMILCVYLLIPLVTMLLKKVSLRVFVIPCVLVFLSSMLLPNVNSLMQLLESDRVYTFKIYSANLFSMYFLYVLGGYWISRGGLRKMKTPAVAAVFLLSFFGDCAYQFWAYSRPMNYLLDYDFCGILLCSLFAFELLRRTADSLRRLERPIVYLSQISFGIYFVHIVIMDSVLHFVTIGSWPHPFQTIFLEAVSMVGAVAVIAVLSRIPWCKRYLFMIKDGKNKLNCAA